MTLRRLTDRGLLIAGRKGEEGVGGNFGSGPGSKQHGRDGVEAPDHSLFLSPRSTQ